MTNAVQTVEWLTVAQVADRLKLSKMTVYRMVEQKALPAFQFGRAYRIRSEDYDEFVRKSATMPSS